MKKDYRTYYKYELRVLKTTENLLDMYYKIAKDYFKTEEDIEKDADDFLNKEEDSEDADKFINSTD